MAVLFLIKRTHKKLKTDPCKIEYVAMDDFWKKEVKLAWFAENDLKNIDFENIIPDKNNNWINNVDNDWESLIAVCDSVFKTGRSNAAIFNFFTNRIISARDEWVYDYAKSNLIKKVEYFTKVYFRPAGVFIARQMCGCMRPRRIKKVCTNMFPRLL